MNKGGTPENLKPFKKGQSGNPKGRPKLPDISEAVAKVLNGEEGAELELQNLLKVQAIRASKGDTKALELLLDRGYGKSKQSIDLKADVSGEVVIERHIKGEDNP